MTTKVWSRLSLVAALVFVVFIQSPIAALAESAKPLPNLFGGPFTMVDQNGATKTERDFFGHYVLIYFGYTYCPDICPTHLQRLAVAVDELGPTAAKLIPIFVTVDPARDNVDHMKDYVSAFHPRLIGLTGSEAQVRQIAKVYRVHRAKVLGESDDDYLVSHSSTIFLMGPKGEFVTLFPHDTATDRIVAILRKHLSS
jgi:protein SCO1/2